MVDNHSWVELHPGTHSADKPTLMINSVVNEKIQLFSFLSSLFPKGIQRCGFVTIKTSAAICCQGLVYVRAGIRPACCGHVAFDAFHQLCCDGRLQRKPAPGSAVQCCRDQSFDVRKALCQDGQVSHKTPKLAPEHFALQAICSVQIASFFERKSIILAFSCC